jgi:hypothetical protein
VEILSGGVVAAKVAVPLAVAICLQLVATMFMSVWLWTIPADYQLPNQLTQNIQRFDRGICSVKVSWSSFEISRQCQD